METLKKALELALMFLDPEELEEKKDEVLELAMELWDTVDPLPDLELDDEVLEAVISWLIDFMIQKSFS